MATGDYILDDSALTLDVFTTDGDLDENAVAKQLLPPPAPPPKQEGEPAQ